MIAYAVTLGNHHNSFISRSFPCISAGDSAHLKKGSDTVAFPAGLNMSARAFLDLDAC